MRKLATIVCSVIIAVGILFFDSSCKNGQNAEQTASLEHKSMEKSETTSLKTGEPVQTEEETASVELPREKQQLIGVRTVTASVQPLHKNIRTTGKIEYDERKLTTVNAKVEGWIEKLYVNFTGIYVKKGEPLVDIFSPELWATQQEFINLVRWSKKISNAGVNSGETAFAAQSGADDLTAMLLKDTDSLMEAARLRLKLWDISDAQIKRIEESEKPIRTLTVYSPVSGYVLQKYAVQGMKVMAGEKLIDVYDLSSVWVLADIYEYELSVIKVGDTAKLQLSYFPGEELIAKIDFVSPTLSPETRTAQVRFSVPNAGGKLKPGMFTDVELKINLGKRLAIPDEAVIDTGLRQIVYVDKGDGYFEPRAIITGLKAGKLVEVLSGIKAGETVASSGNFLIDSETKLKGIEPAGASPPNEQESAPASAGHKH